MTSPQSWTATVDARAYGAKFDGATDDTTAIQAAIASGAGTVKLPAGTALITTLTFTSNYQRIVGQGRGITTLKAKAGATKLLDVTGTDVTIEHMTLDGNAIATYCIFAETLGTRGTVRCLDITGATTAGVANTDQNHTWAFERCFIYLNTGRGVIWIKRGQNTRFDECFIYANTLGQVQIGEATTAMSLVTFNKCAIQNTSGVAGVPNIQVSAQVNPLIVRDCYFETFGAGGTDLTVDSGLSVSGITWAGCYSTGNAVANYQMVIASQVYLDLTASHGISFVTGNFNDSSTASRFFHFNSNENGSARVPFKLDAVNPVYSVVTLVDAATVAIDVRLGRYFLVPITTNRTLGTPSGPTAGMEITLDLTATAAATLTLPAAFKSTGNMVASAASKHTVASFYYNGTNWIETNRTVEFAA